MAIATFPNLREYTVGGTAPAWFRHRVKAQLDAAITPLADIGTAADHGIDPLITTIPVTTTGTDGVCNMPTYREWSTTCDGQAFRFVFTGITGAGPTLTVRFYAVVRGSTGVAEAWQVVSEPYTVVSGDEPLVIPTRGQEIFCHIENITNPDGSASLSVECIRGSAVAGGGDLDIGSEEGDAAIGIKGYYAVGGRWSYAAVDNLHRLQTYDATAHTDLASILAALGVLEVYSEYGSSAAILCMLGKPGVYHSPSHFAAAYVDDENLAITIPANMDPPSEEEYLAVLESRADGTGIPYLRGVTAFNLSGAGPYNLHVADAEFDATSVFVVVVSGVNIGTEIHDSPFLQGYVGIVGGQAHAGIPPATADLDATRFAFDLAQSAKVHQTNALNYTNDSVTSREQPPTAATQGTRDCTVINTAYPIVAVSTPCVAVFLTAAEANAGICIWGGSTITTAGAGISKASQAPSYLIPIDDAAKIYVAGSNAGDDVNFAILTR